MGIVDPMTHNEWFRTTAATDSVNAAAIKAEIPQRTLGRWLDAGNIPSDAVIKLSRAYGINPVQALIDTDYLTPEEAQGEVTILNWADVSDAELAYNMLKRMDPEGIFWEPLSEATVTEIMQTSPEEPTPLIAVVTPPHGIPLQGQRAAKKAPKGWRDETDQ